MSKFTYTCTACNCKESFSFKMGDNLMKNYLCRHCKPPTKPLRPGDKAQVIIPTSFTATKNFGEN